MASFATDDDEQIAVELPSEDGKGVDEYLVYPPTTEQLLLFAAALGTPERSAQAILELIEDIFEPDDFAKIRRRLRARRGDPARLHIDDITEVVERVVGGKTDFPTQPSSDSSPTPAPTGRRSTGRVHSPASTPSVSARAAS